MDNKDTAAAENGTVAKPDRASKILLLMSGAILATSTALLIWTMVQKRKYDMERETWKAKHVSPRLDNQYIATADTDARQQAAEFPARNASQETARSVQSSHVDAKQLPVTTPSEEQAFESQVASLPECDTFADLYVFRGDELSEETLRLARESGVNVTIFDVRQGRPREITHVPSMITENKQLFIGLRAIVSELSRYARTQVAQASTGHQTPQEQTQTRSLAATSGALVDDDFSVQQASPSGAAHCTETFQFSADVQKLMEESIARSKNQKK